MTQTETPTGTITTTRHSVTGTTYAGVATFRLQQHSEYFFDLINGLGFYFPRLCFINEPRTPVSTVRNPGIHVLQTRNTINIDDGRPSNFPRMHIADLRRKLTRDIDLEGIRRELVEKSEQRSQYAILIFWTYTTTN